METSLLKTLASKNQTSVMQEVKRLNSTTKTSEGPRKCLQLIIPREDKKQKPLVATFGGISLKRCKNPVIQDQVILPYIRMRSEIVERLLNDTCEVCVRHPNWRLTVEQLLDSRCENRLFEVGWPCIFNDQGLIWGRE